MRDAKMRSETPYMLFGVMFTVIAVIALIGIVMLNSRADTTDQDALITNSTPVIDNVYISVTSDTDATPTTEDASINLNENATKRVYVHGTATDQNGCNQIDSREDTTGMGNTYPASWQLIFQSSDATGTPCTTDDRNCYATTTPELYLCGGQNDLTLTYEFKVDVFHFASATDGGSGNWIAKVAVSDEYFNDGAGPGVETTAATSAVVQDTTEMNTLGALNVTSAVDYGSIALGKFSKYEGAGSVGAITVTNTGNSTNLDVDVYGEVTGGYAWTCGSGTKMVVGQTTWSLTGSTAVGPNAYASHTMQADITTDVANSDLGVNMDKQQSIGAPSTRTVYTQLAIPASGVTGACESTLTFTAAAI